MGECWILCFCGEEGIFNIFFFSHTNSEVKRLHLTFFALLLLWDPSCGPTFQLPFQGGSWGVI